MNTTKLNNITIKQLQDVNFNDYYIIINNDDNNEAYFCFAKAVKHGWDELVNNYSNIKEVEIEYEEAERGKKVIEIAIIEMHK